MLTGAIDPKTLRPCGTETPKTTEEFVLFHFIQIMLILSISVLPPNVFFFAPPRSLFFHTTLAPPSLNSQYLAFLTIAHFLGRFLSDPDMQCIKYFTPPDFEEILTLNLVASKSVHQFLHKIFLCWSYLVSIPKLKQKSANMWAKNVLKGSESAH